MSVVTGFNFSAYSRDLTRESHNSKDGVALSVMSSADIRQLATVEIVTPCGREEAGMPWRPLPAGSTANFGGHGPRPGIAPGRPQPTLWDNHMGNFNVRPLQVQPCATCAEANEGFQHSTKCNDRCNGHYGVISMPRRPLTAAEAAARAHAMMQGASSDDEGLEQQQVALADLPFNYVYSPLLFDELVRLARAECFFCYDFRAPAQLVARYTCALALFDMGLVGEALHFLQAFPAVTSAVASAAGRGGAVVGARAALARAALQQKKERRTRSSSSKKNSKKSSKKRTKRDDNNDDDAEQSDDEEGQEENKVVEGDDEDDENNNNKDEAIDKMSKFVADARERAKANGTLPKRADLEMQQRSVQDIRNDLVKEAIATLCSVPRECRRCGGESPQMTVKQGQIYAHWTQTALTKNVARDRMTQEQRGDIEKEMASFNRLRVRMEPFDVRRRLEQLFQKDISQSLLLKMYPHLGEPAFPSLVATKDAAVLSASNNKRDIRFAFDLFFLDCVPVPPLPHRLSGGVEVQEAAGKLAPDDCTRKLSEILNFVEATEQLLFRPNHDETMRRQLESNQCHLQLKVNELFTRTLDGFAKKQGLFRNNMMGKRVNQACRSVISPDFTVEPNQLLLPRSFARRLTFPETVTTYSPERTAFLKRCVINGPNVYPGAVSVEIRKPSGQTEVKSLFSRALQQKEREQIANECFALVENGGMLGAGSGHEVRVHRHVIDDDRVIFNRQPTLHKPSMMSYRARVLSGLKTIRFHYVSAKSFNADFDGDEMNVHVPQGLECRAEMDTIMDANLNYLMPTSGKPIRGLIQDHCDAGVLLAARDKFFTLEDFVQLAFLGIGPYIGTGASARKQLAFLTPVPAIMKPKRLWSGKQIFSVLFRFITMCNNNNNNSNGDNVTMLNLAGGQMPKSSSSPNMTGKRDRNASTQAAAAGAAVASSPSASPGVAAKRQTTTFSSAWAFRDGKVVTPDHFVSKLPDNPVIVLNSELLVGVLDKSQTGPQNLSIAHVVHEVFGPHHVGVFFGALGRLLTYGLQKEGFSMGIDDMLMNDDPTRSAMLREIDVGAARAQATAGTDPLGFINEQASALQKHFFPLRQRVPFPENQLVMMTISGAKGSPTNAVQMNLVIGQQTFDSKRIGRTLSGRTLPCFFVGDRRARSFGFVMGRFASGISPGEYTITAMSGREGLIDTAIKTARSGELERCLMKGLESVKVHWGGVVRDGDGGLIQTRYGGDGLDPCKASTLKEFDMLQRNSKAILDSLPAAFRDETQLKEDILPIYQRTVDEARLSSKIPHSKKTDKELAQVIKARLEWMRVDAGEPVGVLASQAIGEPSTQMTLNTFHSVGTTVSHVSQGIPRLRELMLHASVKSPAVFLPVTSTRCGELGAIDEIKARMSPVKITAFLPPAHILPEPMRWSVSRPAAGTEVQLAIVFDSEALDKHRQACCVSGETHVEYFRSSLKRFAVKFRNLITGKRFPLGPAGGAAAAAAKKNGDGGDGDDDNNGGGDGDVGNNHMEDMMTMMGKKSGGSNNNHNTGGSKKNKKAVEYSPILGPDDIDDLGSDMEVDDEGEEVDAEYKQLLGGDDDFNLDGAPSSVGKKNNSSSKKSKKKQQQKQQQKGKLARKAGSALGGESSDDDENNGDGNNDQENDDDVGSDGAGSVLDDGNNSVKNRGDGDDSSSSAAGTDDDDEHEVVDDDAAAAIGKNVRYDNFPTFGHTKHKFYVSCESRGASPYFTIGFRFELPSRTLAVISDILKEAFETTQFHSSFPQVESVTYHHDGKTNTGQLVFKGQGCYLRSIAAVVAPYSVTSPGLAVDKLTSSDFRDVLRTYGVEAAYQALFEELQTLFKQYAVDSRHLSLVCDVATHHGLWKPFRFSGVAALSSSPLYQMTVAASGKFLRQALARGVTDSLGTVSSSIMTGERPLVGTAAACVSRDHAAQVNVIKEKLNAVLKPMASSLKKTKST